MNDAVFLLLDGLITYLQNMARHYADGQAELQKQGFEANVEALEIARKAYEDCAERVRNIRDEAAALMTPGPRDD